MLFSEIRRLFTRRTRSHAKATPDQLTQPGDSPNIFDFDPMWHGDHWQNLLSSPMDARRYVMEDWSSSIPADWDDAEGAAPAH
ncbi:hypothetical protein LJ655_18600 [Paraburkholderia sp. MMS20-SJTN17]|uniref:Uncharacterized protein n=1 Tax=Paraburkholderia translucens TaxID=2886945 RepID=A0ABS8KGI6_9BURK|nr:hypothetical protein [Paraburkholderia sp. MMS20-SJTN17]MCC8403876.1 hypothetical protein [Paraburkholderia sp. MMS20-SJTN17]